MAFMFFVLTVLRAWRTSWAMAGKRLAKTGSSSGTRKAWYTAPELAAALGLHESTVQNWIREKKLKPDMVTLGGHARFTPETLARLRGAA